MAIFSFIARSLNSASGLGGFSGAITGGGIFEIVA